MKLLSLSVSLLRAKTQFYPYDDMYHFSTLLFNFAINTSSDYLAGKHITATAMIRRYCTVLSSKAPITDER